MNQVYVAFVSVVLSAVIATPSPARAESYFEQGDTSTLEIHQLVSKF
jgi:hypothetical protein